MSSAFSPRAVSVNSIIKNFVFRYRSPAEFVSIFVEFYGPAHKAFLALEEPTQKSLRADLLETIANYNAEANDAKRVPRRVCQNHHRQGMIAAIGSTSLSDEQPRMAGSEIAICAVPTGPHLWCPNVMANVLTEPIVDDLLGRKFATAIGCRHCVSQQHVRSIS